MESTAFRPTRSVAVTLPPRPQQLSAALNHNLDLYALGAIAAGVTLIALTSPAEAKIAYTKTHQPIPPDTHYALDLNQDGIADFTVFNYSGKGTCQGFPCSAGEIWVAIPHGNFVRGYVRSSGSLFGSFASAFRAGVKIQGKKKFLPKLCELSTCNATMAISESGGTSGNETLGPWLNAKNRYLGLKFAIRGKLHYGWARLTTSCANHQCQALLTGYAYETVVNKPIITGKTKGPDVITIQPPTLGHLAQGASAVSVWRGKQAPPTIH